MKTLLKSALLFGLFALGGARANATIAKVQNPGTNCSSSPCSLTISSTGSGNLLVVVAVGGVSDNITAISCTSTCGTWVHCTACESSDASSGESDVEYVLSSTSGATSVSVTQTGASSVFFTEFSTTLSPFLLNTGTTPDGKRDQSSAATSIAGVTLTLSATNGVVVQGAACSATCSAIGSSYVGTFVSNGNGSAYLLNTTSGSAPTWTSTSGRAALTAISFQETPTSGCTSELALLGVGCK